MSHQWHENQDEDGSGAHQKPSAEQSSKTIDDVLQWVCGHDDHSQYDTVHVDSRPYVLGIIKTFDLHLSGWRRQEGVQWSEAASCSHTRHPERCREH